MKSTPENAVKRKLKLVLDKNKAFPFAASAGPYRIKGIPDRVGCHNGRFFGCEAKRKSREAEATQLLRKQEIEAAGGTWFLIDGEESLAILEAWLKGSTP